MSYRESAQSIYDLKYHVVFCTKYRYRVLCGEIANRCRDLIHEICATNYIDIVSGSISPDHVHLLISIPPHISVSKAVQYMKGKSSRKLQQEYAQLRKRYWGQHMWARGYFSVTTGSINEQDVQKYIEEQEIHHKIDDFKISEF